MSIMMITKQPTANLSLDRLSLDRLGRESDPSRATSLLLLLRRWRERNAGIIPHAKGVEPVPTNTSLASLAGGELSERFHAWRGRSGRRYICSVFPVDPRDSTGGLPDFAEAIVIAVRLDAAGARRVVGFCQSEHGAGPVARHAFVTASVAGGAQHWHVHLLTADPDKRRAAIEDIEALCRPGEHLLEAI
jgi:hypothetical protein